MGLLNKASGSEGRNHKVFIKDTHDRHIEELKRTLDQCKYEPSLIKQNADSSSSKTTGIRLSLPPGSHDSCETHAGDCDEQALLSKLMAQVDEQRGQINLAQMATRAAEQKCYLAESSYANELASKAREIEMLKEFLVVAKKQRHDVSVQNEQLQKGQREAEAQRGEAQRERNEARARATDAERRIRHLEKDLQDRNEQLEYTQQRMVQTAAFQFVKSPFEVEKEKKREEEDDMQSRDMIGEEEEGLQSKDKMREAEDGIQGKDTTVEEKRDDKQLKVQEHCQQ
ncbi:hypothetical protein F503_06427 [Ophiostoma piceae UAMH 11346]|uniref:Uncharacterized protein n=1 Tax=Ophiostoma piceae (strain UAMH 11346) TaxID=1262450 RepID=S3BWG3_OPHP1|nr:hypothetical protein F503_06427 [Ophiostoma piceae UAMH 11346]